MSWKCSICHTDNKDTDNQCEVCNAYNPSYVTRLEESKQNVYSNTNSKKGPVPNLSKVKGKIFGSIGLTGTSRTALWLGAWIGAVVGSFFGAWFGAGWTPLFGAIGTFMCGGISLATSLEDKSLKWFGIGTLSFAVIGAGIGVGWSDETASWACIGVYIGWLAGCLIAVLIWDKLGDDDLGRKLMTISSLSLSVLGFIVGELIDPGIKALVDTIIEAVLWSVICAVIGALLGSVIGALIGALKKR